MSNIVHIQQQFEACLHGHDLNWAQDAVLRKLTALATIYSKDVALEGLATAYCLLGLKQEPKTSNTESINYTMTEAAKILDIGSKTLFQELRHMQVLNKNNHPAPDYIKRGFFAVERKQCKVKNFDNFVKHYALTLVTSKGLNYLRTILFQEQTL